jgi:hypothetical protein
MNFLTRWVRPKPQASQNASCLELACPISAAHRHGTPWHSAKHSSVTPPLFSAGGVVGAPETKEKKEYMLKVVSKLCERVIFDNICLFAVSTRMCAHCHHCDPHPYCHHRCHHYHHYCHHRHQRHSDHHYLNHYP